MCEKEAPLYRLNNFTAPQQALSLDRERFPSADINLFLKTNPRGLSINLYLETALTPCVNTCPTKKLTPMGLFVDGSTRELGEIERIPAIYRVGAIEIKVFSD